MSSHILKTSDFEEIKAQLDEAKSDACVLFDVDEVLIASDDPLTRSDVLRSLQPLVMEEILKREFENPLTPGLYVYGRLFTEGKRFLLIETAPKLIADLRARGITTMGLTGLPTSKFGDVEDPVTWRKEQLKEFAIDFGESISFAFDEIQDDFGFTPAFTSNIMFTALLEKGDTIEPLFEKLNLHPKQVFFIEDNMKQAESISLALDALGIEGVGFQYVSPRLEEVKVEPENYRQRVQTLLDEFRDLASK